MDKNTIAQLAFPAVCLGIGMFIGSITRSQIKTWYNKLVKPKFTPPSWLIPIAWTILYIMIGISGYLIWKVEGGFSTKLAIPWGIYYVQLTLNYLWTPLFFGLHEIFLGLIDILLLNVAIGTNIIVFYQIYPIAGYLLIPYLAWVNFATYLNYSLWKLNKDNSIKTA